MDKIRELFHKLANRLNNISLNAGLAREEIKEAVFEEDKRKERDARVGQSLQKIEDAVSLLAKELEELRGLIKLNPESEE